MPQIGPFCEQAARFVKKRNFWQDGGKLAKKQALSLLGRLYPPQQI